MPDRLPTFRPPWAPQAKRQRRPDTLRRSAAARGYCSRGWRLARAERLVLDGYQCQACGRVVPGGRELHVDHVVPKHDGGTDLVDNLQTLCRPCHSRKTVAEQGGVGKAKIGQNFLPTHETASLSPRVIGRGETYEKPGEAPVSATARGRFWGPCDGMRIATGRGS